MSRNGKLRYNEPCENCGQACHWTGKIWIDGKRICKDCREKFMKNIYFLASIAEEFYTSYQTDIVPDPVRIGELLSENRYPIIVDHKNINWSEYRNG